MKKYFYITILLLWGIPGILPAQHVLKSELNGFRPDDILYKQQVNDPRKAVAHLNCCLKGRT
jgi:hypothetical protein